TVTTIAAVAMEMESYDSARVHGHVMTRDEVHRVARRFGELPLAARKQLAGLAEARADVIYAGSVILERIMDHFNSDRVTVSDRGVRWGLVWREFGRVAQGS